MTCQDYRKDIPDFLEGILDQGRAQGLSDHLQSCAACQNEFENYRKSWEALDILTDEEPAPGYVSRFWTRLAAEQSWREKFSFRLKGLLTPRRLAPAFVSACVILTVMFLGVSRYLQSRESALLAKMDTEELELIENIELAENYDILENLELLEDLDVLNGSENFQS